MIKIIRIIGVAMFLLTLSSNVWAKDIKDITLPPPIPKVPTVTAPRTNPSPRRAGYGDYYYHDDYYARHPKPTLVLKALPIPTRPAVRALAIPYPTPKPFYGSAASAIGVIQKPNPFGTLNVLKAKLTTTRAPANNRGYLVNRHIPK